MRHLETILECGLLSQVSKTDYIIAFESLEVTSKHFEKGEVIFKSGAVVDKICIVECGCVREERVYEDGEVCIIHNFSEKGIFALEAVVSSKKTVAADYVCSEDATVVYIPYRNIEKSKWVNEIQSTLLKIMADRSFRDLCKVEILARRGVRERILLYLEHLQQKTGSNTVLVRMDREQFAQFLCVNRSSLSNELNQLKREGIIDFEKNKFVLLK